MTDTQKLERYKNREDWSVDEIVRHARTGQQPENPEYVQRKIECLRADGFDAEADELEAETTAVPVEDMTPAQHFERLRERRS